jgi:hypothetical protein
LHEGGLRGTPLGLLTPLGERGGHPHNNRGLPNNSKIKDFYRANFPLSFRLFFPLFSYPDSPPFIFPGKVFLKFYYDLGDGDMLKSDHGR